MLLLSFNACYFCCWTNLIVVQTKSITVVLENFEVLKSMPLIEAARRLQLSKGLQVRDHVPVLCVLKYKHAFERIKRVAPLYDARAMVEAWQSGSQSFSAFRARCAK